MNKDIAKSIAERAKHLYEPFGDEWKREMAKLSKDQIISMYKKQAEEITHLHKELAEYQKVYAAARGLCMGYDWNNGTHAKYHRNMLVDLVDAISPLPDKDGHKRKQEPTHDKD